METLNDLLAESVSKYPRKTALIFFGKRISYQKLDVQVKRFAASFKRLGVARGDRVAIMLPNCPQNVIAYFAALKLGAIVAQFNPQYGSAEIEYQLKDSQPKVFLTLDILAEKLARVNVGLPTLILTSVADCLPFPLNILYRLKQWKENGYGSSFEIASCKTRCTPIYKFKSLLKKLPAIPFPLMELNDIAVLQYTGGTTGVSKGAMLTHGNLASNVKQLAKFVPSLKPGKEVILGAMPFFHCFGMTVCQNFGLFLGAAIALVPNPRDLNALLKTIDKYKPTIFPGIPRLYMAINVFAEKNKKLDFSSIHYCISGAAALPDAVLEKFEELTGGILAEGFGLTEASPVTHCNPLRREHRKKGSIGIVLPDTAAKIVDDAGKEVSIGEAGELTIRGPQIMKGYWNMPEETEKTLKMVDGEKWLFTGDIAKVDRDGFFYIVDRKKDMINVGGENVFSLEVEEVLYRYPLVAEAAVVGVKDKRGDEEVKAFVVRKDSDLSNEDLARDIKKFCQEKLSSYKVPKKIVFLAEIPKTPIGKPDKKALRNMK